MRSGPTRRPVTWQSDTRRSLRFSTQQARVPSTHAPSSASMRRQRQRSRGHLPNDVQEARALDLATPDTWASSNQSWRRWWSPAGAASSRTPRKAASPTARQSIKHGRRCFHRRGSAGASPWWSRGARANEKRGRRLVLAAARIGTLYRARRRRRGLRRPLRRAEGRDRDRGGQVLWRRRRGGDARARGATIETVG